MKKVFVLSTAAIAGLMSFNASATDILARVISSTPVVQQVAVPRQVCNNQPMVVESPRTGGGAVLGAVAGGAVGNAIGNGGGRALATVIGLVGGAMVGDRIEGGNQQVQNVQQCGTQTFYENRASHYNVVYEYAGQAVPGARCPTTQASTVRRCRSPPWARSARLPQYGFQSQQQPVCAARAPRPISS